MPLWLDQALHASGRLGECRCKTGAGEIRVEHAAAVRLTTGYGDVSVDRVEGRAEVSTGSGAVRMGALEGGGTIRNSNGATWIGAAHHDLRVKAGNGAIAVERALASVDARCANGGIRLDEVAHGVVAAQTAAGRVEIGVRDGVTAYLDLDTGSARCATTSTTRDAPNPMPTPSRCARAPRSATSSSTARWRTTP